MNTGPPGTRCQVDVSYEDVTWTVKDRGMTVNWVVKEMDWWCFDPLTVEESFARDALASATLQDLSDNE